MVGTAADNTVADSAPAAAAAAAAAAAVAADADVDAAVSWHCGDVFFIPVLLFPS